jgi:hypothetical protein
MKKLEIYADDEKFGECDIFLYNNKVIGVVYGNDGDYREEYFNPIFKAVGINVVRRTKALTKKQIQDVISMGGMIEEEND